MSHTDTTNTRWATLRQAARYCGLSERHLQNLISEGLIASSLVKRPDASRGRRLVDLRSLDEWIENGLMKVGPRPCTDAYSNNHQRGEEI
jgi:hypothetical protein